MNIFVLRHGKAEAAGSGVTDSERALTTKGKDEISRLAAWLANRDEKVDLIFTSPLKRAVETADIVARALKVKEVKVTDSLSPGFNPDSLSHEISSAKGDCVMIVGHEPDLSSFVSWVISGEKDAAVVMVKGGLARIRDFSYYERPSGELHWLINPDLIKGCSHN